MEVYQLLIDAHGCRSVIDDWLANDIACDLRFRRAKTKGHVVIETTDVLFGQRVLSSYYCKQCQVKRVEKW